MAATIGFNQASLPRRWHRVIASEVKQSPNVRSCRKQPFANRFNGRLLPAISGRSDQSK